MTFFSEEGEKVLKEENSSILRAGSDMCRYAGTIERPFLVSAFYPDLRRFNDRNNSAAENIGASLDNIGLFKNTYSLL